MLPPPLGLLRLVELFYGGMGVGLGVGTKGASRGAVVGCTNGACGGAIVGGTNGACGGAVAARVGGGICKGVFGNDVPGRGIVEAGGRGNPGAGLKG